VPAPFGWDPTGFWVTTLTLGTTALLLAIGVPASWRRWRRTDAIERERVANVLDQLARDLVGVQVFGGTNGKCLRLRVPLPEGRAWSVESLRVRRFRRRRRDPRSPEAFRRAYRTADPERLTVEARVALLDMLDRAVDVVLEPAGLTVWTLRPRGRADPLIDTVTHAEALVPYVHRTAAAALLLLADA
jgi:hypothetical protein